MKKVLFVLGSSFSPFNSLFILAKSIKDEFEPVFLLSSSQFEKKTKDLESENIKYIKFYTLNSQKEKKKRFEFLKNFSLPLFLYSFKHNKNFQKLYGKLNILENVAAVVTGCDRCVGLENVALKWAKDKGIKRFVIPFAYSDELSRLDARKEKSELGFDIIKSPWINFYLANKYPSQVFDNKGIKRLFFRADLLLALKKFNSLPDNPWYVGGSGLVNYVCTQGMEESERLQKAGIKNYIIGHPEHDLLYESFLKKEKLKKELGEKYALDMSKKTVMFALPQWYENNVLSREESNMYHKHMINSIVKENVNLLISLHPKMDADYYRSLYPEVKILKEPLSSVLPAADMFIASFVGTATWAMLLGIPTILMNQFDFKYPYLMKQKGIIKCDLNEFEQYIKKTLNDKTFYEKLILFQKESRDYFAKFDGKVCKRFKELLCS